MNTTTNKIKLDKRELSKISIAFSDFSKVLSTQKVSISKSSKHNTNFYITDQFYKEICLI